MRVTRMTLVRSCEVMSDDVPRNVRYMLVLKAPFED